VTDGGVFANRRFTLLTLPPPPVLGHLAPLEERNSRLSLLFVLFVLGGRPLPAFVRPEQAVSRRISVTRVRPATHPSAQDESR
jgi:hypothetical protein